MTGNKPIDRLRHHVTGAIERGEAEPIVEQPIFSAGPAAIANLIDRARMAAQALELAALLERKPSADSAAYLREQARRLREALKAVM